MNKFWKLLLFSFITIKLSTFPVIEHQDNRTRVLSVLLWWLIVWPLALREGPKVKIFKGSVPKKKFELRRVKVKDKFGRLCNENLKLLVQNNDRSCHTVWCSENQMATKVIAQNMSVTAGSCTALSWYLVLWCMQLSLLVCKWKFIYQHVPLCPLKITNLILTPKS